MSNSTYRVQFYKEHLKQLELQDIQEDEEVPEQEHENVERLSTTAFTFVDGHGTVLCCTGTLQDNNMDLAFVWALLSKDITPSSFRYIHKSLKEEIDRLPQARVDMLVKKHVPKTQRWARLLGFKPTGKPVVIEGVEYLRYKRYK